MLHISFKEFKATIQNHPILLFLSVNPFLKPAEPTSSRFGTPTHDDNDNDSADGDAL